MLEIRGVGKGYRNGTGKITPVLRDVSLSIAPGERFVLYGPSGSGKTTFLRIIAALIRPDAGSVTVGGRDVTAFTPDEAAQYRKEYLGYVDQSLDLVPGIPMIDNATLKLLGDCSSREARQRLRPLLERLGLADQLDQNSDYLSAGERQRVLIARALSTEPELIVADEPTGNLDTDRSKEVLALLTEVCEERGIAMLLVTHDPIAASYATSVRELKGGVLVSYDLNGR